MNVYGVDHVFYELYYFLVGRGGRELFISGEERVEDALLASCLLIEWFPGGSWLSYGGCDVELAASGGRSSLRKSASSASVMTLATVSISLWRSLIRAGVSADSMMAVVAASGSHQGTIELRNPSSSTSAPSCRDISRLIASVVAGVRADNALDAAR